MSDTTKHAVMPSISTYAEREAERLTQTVRRMVEAYQPMLHQVSEAQKRLFAVMPSYTPRDFTLPFPKEQYMVLPSRTSRYQGENVPQAYPHSESTQSRVVAVPNETRWENIEIRFIDALSICVLWKNKKIGIYSHDDLGFAKKNTNERTPDKQWGLLLKLSLIGNNRDLIKPTTDTLHHEFHTSKEALQKIKESLAKKLSAAFGIDDSPLLPYKSEEGYRTIFKLTTESTLRGTGELYASGKRYREELIEHNIDDTEE